MAQNKKQRKAPVGKGVNSLLIILVSLILIGIPIFMIGRVVLSSYLEAGQPLHGERYQDQIAQEISTQQIESLTTSLSSVENVEGVEINLQSGTLKVVADLSNGISKEQGDAAMMALYDKLIETLPVETYFTQSEGMRNYDLEILGYDNLETLGYNAVINKTSGMDEFKLDDLNEPLDPATTQSVLENLQEQEEQAEEAPAEEPAP